VGLGSKHDIVLVKDRVLEEKIALVLVRSLNSNNAIFTSATVSQCLLDLEFAQV